MEGREGFTLEQEPQLTRNATSQLSNYVTLFLAAQLEAVGCGTKVVVNSWPFYMYIRDMLTLANVSILQKCVKYLSEEPFIDVIILVI